MLTCRSVWGFECLVSILSFKFFIRFSLHQKMNHNYFLYLRCFVVVSFVLLGVPDHGAVPNHGPVQGAVCTKQSDGAVPHMWHMMFLDQIMVLDLINMWTFTLDIIIFLTAFNKPQKSWEKNMPKNREKPSKTEEHLKDLFPGSLGEDMSLARVAENSKGDRRCLDEICAKWNAYMCL